MSTPRRKITGRGEVNVVRLWYIRCSTLADWSPIHSCFYFVADPSCRCSSADWSVNSERHRYVSVRCHYAHAIYHCCCIMTTRSVYAVVPEQHDVCAFSSAFVDICSCVAACCHRLSSRSATISKEGSIFIRVE